MLRIVVPVVADQESETALEVSCQLAAERNASLTAVV